MDAWSVRSFSLFDAIVHQIEVVKIGANGRSYARIWMRKYMPDREILEIDEELKKQNMVGLIHQA